MLNRFLYFPLRPIILITIMVALMSIEGFSQQKIGFYSAENVKKTDLRFDLLSNLIVIPVTINGKITLKFILDTGAETSILTEKLFGDVLGLNYSREIILDAPGIKDSIGAYIATGISMNLTKGVTGHGLNMLVLKEDYLELSKSLGEEIYGIIGYDIFSRFVVSIDYDNKILTLTDPEKFRPRPFSKAVPLEIIDTKPYLNLKVKQVNKNDSLKLMVDTGASHALLLDANDTEAIDIPETTIATRLGRGLAGEIPGLFGRIEGCQISKFEFNSVLSSFPISGVYMQAIKRGSRNGTVGGEVLRRMNVTFDYGNQTLYLKKGEKYKDPFEYDMSGMILKADGLKLDSLVVAKVIPDTPASEEGLIAGDLILRVNSMNLQNTTLSRINALLRKKPGLRIHMIIMREGEKLKKSIKLKRLI